jgi:copper chaperone CopZ
MLAVRRLIMKSILVKPIIVLLAFASIVAFAYAERFTNRFYSFLLGSESAIAQEAETYKAVFIVKCYDDGKAALQHLKGVQKIETGFHHMNETDTVFYNPKVIKVEDMESALKKAGTYVKTLE